jgi:hypothetical protein
MAAVLAESPVGVAWSATGRFEVGYVAEDGAEHRVRLDEAWLVPLERALPVRRFGAREEQRHLSGLWWSATTGGHVGFESWLKRDHLVALDFDRSVAGIGGLNPAFRRARRQVWTAPSLATAGAPVRTGGTTITSWATSGRTRDR